jgi:hypothetical protein
MSTGQWTGVSTSRGRGRKAFRDVNNFRYHGSHSDKVRGVIAHPIFCVVESPSRITIEKQDDPAIWFTWAVKNGRVDIARLLPGPMRSIMRFTDQDVSDPVIGGAGEEPRSRYPGPCRRLAGKAEFRHLWHHITP